MFIHTIPRFFKSIPSILLEWYRYGIRKSTTVMYCPPYSVGTEAFFEQFIIWNVRDRAKNGPIKVIIKPCSERIADLEYQDWDRENDEA
ncbi:hypothetical protein JXQ70_19865 [bacterium]|nr:hypothetical protein [bacterium]